jgi:hypothetical protein
LTKAKVVAAHFAKVEGRTQVVLEAVGQAPEIAERYVVGPKRGWNPPPWYVPRWHVDEDGEETEL